MWAKAVIALGWTFLLSMQSTAYAQNKAVLTGVWKGQYSCGGTSASLTVVISPTGDRFVFSYPNGVSGEYRLGGTYDPNRRQFIATPRGWISEQPRGYRMVGLTGTVSEDLRTISGTIPSCGPFSIRLDTGAAPPPRMEALPPASAVNSQTAPVPYGNARERANARSMPAASVATGTWASTGAACLKGPTDFRVEFGKRYPDNSDALVFIRPQSEAAPFEMKARTSPGRLPNEVMVTTELASTGPLSREPSVLFLQADPIYPGRVRGRANSPYCTSIRFERADENLIAGRPASVPADLASFAGAWDGAMFMPRNGGVVEVAFEIKPSTAGVQGRVFDVQFTVDKRVGTGGLLIAGDKFALRPDRSSPAKMDATINRKIEVAGGREFLAMSMFANGKGSWAYAWRRAPGARTSLQALCSGEVNDWQVGRMNARKMARELKVAFFPALAAYNTDRASLAEAAATAGSLQAAAGNLGVEQLLRDCALTAPGLATIEELHLLDEFVDLPAIRRARPRLSDGIEPGAILTSISTKTADLGRIRSETQAAEAALFGLASRGNALSGVQPILDFARASLPTIQNARPSSVARALGPLTAKLDQADYQADGRQAAQRREYAASRMRGIAVPSASAMRGRAPLLNAITSGGMPTFARSDTSFIAGMLGQSVEKCGEPPLATRLILLGLIKEGMQLGLGMEYSSDLKSMLGSMAKGNVDALAGSEFSKGLGCKSPYLNALYDILAKNVGSRGQGKGGRPGMFVRTCSLDRNAPQCECMRSVMETATPGISGSRYDRAMISSLISRSPTSGIELATRCQVGNY